MAAEDARKLATTVTPRLLRRLAGGLYYDRGEAYYDEGAVSSLRAHRDGVKAVVEGTHSYRVRLWLEDGELGHDCTCPLGLDDLFCKHCVAAGLAWHAGDEAAEGAEDAETEAGTEAEETGATGFGEEDLRVYLLGRDKEELVSLLLEQAREDERLSRRLMVRAAQATPGSAELAVWQEAFDDAVETAGFVSYGDVYDYASGIDEMVESLEALLREADARGAIDLAEYAIAALERSLGDVDDSGGRIGGLLHRLQELHLEACRAARPDPVELAERLFAQETDSTYDLFHDAATVYADVLGEAGLAAHRRLAEAAWAKVPALGPGEEVRDGLGRRYTLTTIMKTMAREAGDLDALAAVMARDLTSPYAFLKIAEIYRDAGDADQALDWAERGWRAFADSRRDERLRVFIAETYQGRGRHDDAVTLVWEAFTDDPSLHTYRQLRIYAEPAGDWPSWRDKALEVIRDLIAGVKTPAADRRAWMGLRTRDRSLLVEIFLDEGDPDGAWREAEAGGCSQGLWLELAGRREKTHPESSVKIYRDHVASLLQGTGNDVYKEVVRHLTKIRTILARSGQEPAFRRLLTEIRTGQKRKRNLMKLLDHEGW